MRVCAKVEYKISMKSWSEAVHNVWGAELPHQKLSTKLVWKKLNIKLVCKMSMNKVEYTISVGGERCLMWGGPREYKYVELQN